MGDAGFFKGTSAEQDARFSDKQKKLLRSMHFPPEFNQKIDMKKVNLKVIKGWMAQRINQLLGIEDEVVIEYAFGMLEEDSPDPKTIQINLQGFLDKNSQVFVLELWKLLISAQNSLGGIPQQFVDQAKEELLAAKRAKELELAKIKEQEEKERAVAEEVRKKAQAIREATRPTALSLSNGSAKDTKGIKHAKDIKDTESTKDAKEDKETSVSEHAEGSADVASKSAAIDSHALENELREKLLRERVLKSVKNRTAVTTTMATTSADITQDREGAQEKEKDSVTDNSSAQPAEGT
ncbi:PWI domain-containing protein [Lobosporangium transversale]|uniref:PWI domain-containing protein n=1 Tax=Lobosporangium transversale TaxID=64571 RepID=A0A1Y2H0B2_9FUNG|nr:PWI domain-containing protein [Lobosporangium transversale]ORZ27153.1 PWI domain-containing protein [Lobosporangium transversale]|eukprot:XP_021884900.1 PWI domain-containing protein [Lobosporangium transversale]